MKTEDDDDNDEEEEMSPELLTEVEKEVEEGILKGNFPDMDEMRRLNVLRLQGHMKAREQMILGNMGLVYSIASRWCSTLHPSYKDTCQAGMIGLMRAVDRYDHTYESKFSTYAAHLITQQIRERWRDEEGLIRIASGRQDENIKLKRVIGLIEQELGRRPTIAEICDEIGLAPERLYEFFAMSSPISSLDAPLVEGEEGTGMHGVVGCTNITPDRAAEAIDEGKAVFASLYSLRKHLEEGFSQKYREIFFKRFGLFGYGPKKTLVVVAQEFNITRERVRQVCKMVFTNRLRYKKPIKSEEELCAAIQLVECTLELLDGSDDPIIPLLREVVADKPQLQ